MVLGFISVQVAAGALLYALGFELQVSGDVSFDDAATIGAIQAIGITAIGVLVLAGHVSWRALALRAPRGSFAAGWRALLPVGALVIGPSVGVALASDDPLVDADIGLSLAAAFVVLALLIAINEELWFRGLLVDALDTARRPWLTILGSAVLFGLPHMGSSSAHVVNAVAVTLAVGIPFTVVRMHVGSLGPLIAWHALIDTWAFLHTASVTPQGSLSAGEIAATLVLPSLVAIGYVLWFRRVSVTPSPRLRTSPPRR